VEPQQLELLLGHADPAAQRVQGGHGAPDRGRGVGRRRTRHRRGAWSFR